MIVALDLATTMGFAMGEPGGRPTSGTVRLCPTGGDDGEAGLGLMRWMQDVIAAAAPSSFIVEAPLVPQHGQGRTNISTVRRLIGLVFLAEAVAKAKGITIREATVSDVRTHFLGKGRIPKGEGKRLVMRQCDVLGWTYRDNNAADALALWSFGCAVVAPKTALAVTPLFGHSAVASKRIAEAVAKDDAKRNAERLFVGIEDIPE